MVFCAQLWNLEMTFNSCLFSEIIFWDVFLLTHISLRFVVYLFFLPLFIFKFSFHFLFPVLLAQSSGASLMANLLFIKLSAEPNIDTFSVYVASELHKWHLFEEVNLNKAISFIGERQTGHIGHVRKVTGL